MSNTTEQNVVDFNKLAEALNIPIRATYVNGLVLHAYQLPNEMPKPVVRSMKMVDGKLVAAE